MNTLLSTQLICLLVLATISLMYRSQWLPFKFFAAFFALSVLVWLLSGIVAFIKAGMAYQQQASLAWVTVCALIMGVVIFSMTFMFVKTALKYPAIHDISTDTQNPPEFIYASTSRGVGDNPLDYNAKVIQQQKEAYPELESLKTDLSYSEAFAKAKAVALDQGWLVEHANEKEGYIEAVSRTALLKFTDDIVVRVQAVENGSIIDIRSASRVGKSDLGANTKRIRQYFSAYSE